MPLKPAVFGVEWAMPNKWTFQMAPVAAFLHRWIAHDHVVIDPFAGTSTLATWSNDLASGGVDAEEFCNSLLARHVSADAVLFDPPYSPRQISECYRALGRHVTSIDTQNSALYRRVRAPLWELLRPGGVALSFGWQSSGFGRKAITREILLVQHGGAHNDTICVAQEKPL